MLRRTVVPTTISFLAILAFRSSAEAAPVTYSIDTCVADNCAALAESGGGAIVADIDVINGNDL